MDDVRLRQARLRLRLAHRVRREVELAEHGNFLRDFGVLVQAVDVPVLEDLLANLNR